MERNAFDRLRAFGADGGEFEAAHLLQRFREISELRREVVVNEKNFHRLFCSDARRKGSARNPLRPNSRRPKGWIPFGPSERIPVLVDGRLVAVGEVDRHVADGENLVVTERDRRHAMHVDFVLD